MTSGSGRDGVTFSNSDAYFMRLGTSDPHRLDITTPRIDVMAGGRINGLGLPGQGGDTRFLHRFSLLPHAAYNQNIAMRFALEVQNPFVTGPATGPLKGALLAPKAWSLLSPNFAQALVWAVKPAEEGIAAGVIVRLWNQKRLPVTAGLACNSAMRLPRSSVPRASRPMSRLMIQSRCQILPRCAATRSGHSESSFPNNFLHRLGRILPVR